MATVYTPVAAKEAIVIPNVFVPCKLTVEERDVLDWIARRLDSLSRSDAIRASIMLTATRYGISTPLFEAAVASRRESRPKKPGGRGRVDIEIPDELRHPPSAGDDHLAPIS